MAPRWARRRPAGLAVLRTYLDGFWERALAAFEQAAQDNEGEDG